jgi:hypothetical protein
MQDQHASELSDTQVEQASHLARVGQSSLDAALILLDFRKWREAHHLLRQALRAQMRAVLAVRPGISASDAEDLLGDLQQFCARTSLLDEGDAEVVRVLLERPDDELNWADDRELGRELSNVTTRAVVRFCSRCDRAVKIACGGRSCGKKAAGVLGLSRFFSWLVQSVCRKRDSGVMRPGEEGTTASERPKRDGTGSQAEGKRFRLAVVLGLVVVIEAVVVAVLMGRRLGHPAPFLEPPSAPSPPSLVVLTGKETGLLGTYYAATELSELPQGAQMLLQRVDPTIEFTWTERSPGPGVPLMNYSVRWTGQIMIETSGEYALYTESDDGARLWVDGRRLIDDWVMHGVEARSAKVTLVRGWHDIQLDYLQLEGDAEVRFLWQPPGGERTVVPPAFLRPRIP